MQKRNPKNSVKTLKHSLEFRNEKIKVFRDRISSNEKQRDYVYSMNQSAASIIAENEKGEICFLREYRYPVQEVLWGLPGGGLGKDRSSLNAAKRELFEETGLKASKWKFLGQTFPRPSSSCDVGYFYLAQGLDKTKMSLDHQEDDEDILEVRFLSWKKILSMIRKNEIKDHWDLAGLALYGAQKK